MLARGSIRSFHISRSLQNENLSSTQHQVEELLKKLTNLAKMDVKQTGREEAKNIVPKKERSVFNKSPRSFSKASNEVKAAFDTAKGDQSSTRPSFIAPARNGERTKSKAQKPRAPRQKDFSKGNREKILSNSEDSKTKTSTATIVKTNPNLSTISLKYTPEVPTIEELLINSPASSLSNTAESRIVRLLKELKVNDTLDVNSALKGQAEVASLDLSAFANNENLKNNAQIVLNALNKNKTISFATKVQLLKPLTGLGSIKSLP
ncbi:hypothetical protein WICPIJ_007845 [Wickerhamomyces pijperi]|uniref:Uncharacterized protein n=1 Tax=Wickerhamomyces pijperi TaxID=599730 RepID=A0A9P8Q0Y7_WICPI|nr:hypothetical protein WICPIJ_007845 [Wickerhamomyces pijperi]